MSKKFNIIYADPPWSYKNWSNKGKSHSSAEHHYKTMTKEDIQNLPVQQIAADDCILFLWVTFPCLEEGLELVKKWGFTYKTVGFNWVKRNKKSDSWFWGMGYWTRANSEICIIATRGKVERKSRSVHQILDDRIEKHSKKPDRVRDLIVELCGDKPRIELFAREKVKGWVSVGNEIDKKDIKEALEDIIGGS